MHSVPRLAAAVVIVLPLLALSGTPLDQRGFTRSFADRLRKTHPDAQVEVVRDLEVRWTPARGHEYTAFLDNAWRDYQRTPDDLQPIMERMLESAAESVREEGHVVDRSRVVAIIKDRSWLEESRRALKARGARDVSRVADVSEELNGDLTIFYAEDREKGMAYLTTEALAKAGLERKELRGLAVKNLRALLPVIEIHGSDGLYMVTAGGNYEASLLLLDGFWSGDSIAPKVKGEVVVAVPARDLLLVTGSKDAAGLARLREVARKAAAESSYSLTDKLFVRREGRFVPFRGP